MTELYVFTARHAHYVCAFSFRTYVTAHLAKGVDRTRVLEVSENPKDAYKVPTEKLTPLNSAVGGPELRRPSMFRTA